MKVDKIREIARRSTPTTTKTACGSGRDLAIHRTDPDRMTARGANGDQVSQPQSTTAKAPRGARANILQSGKSVLAEIIMRVCAEGVRSGHIFVGLFYRFWCK